MKKVLLFVISLFLLLSFACSKPTPTPDDKPTPDPEKDPTITLSKLSVTLFVDEEEDIIVTVSDNLGFDVKVSNEEIASFENGKVKGLKAGSTTITFTIKSKTIKTTLQVTVKEKEVQEVKVVDSLKEAIDYYSKSSVVNMKMVVSNSTTTSTLIIKGKFASSTIQSLDYEYTDNQIEKLIYVKDGNVYSSNNGIKKVETLIPNTSRILQIEISTRLFTLFLEINKLDDSKIELVSSDGNLSTYKSGDITLDVKVNENNEVVYIKYITTKGFIEMDFGPRGLSNVTIDYPNDLATNYGN